MPEWAGDLTSLAITFIISAVVSHLLLLPKSPSLAQGPAPQEAIAKRLTAAGIGVF